jgi:CRISPR/Cas system-associated exonuclease Cas4 (RecB family)
MIVSQDFLEVIYDDYLNDLQKKKSEEVYVGHEDKYSASSAGQCFKKHWYKTNKYEGTPIDQRTNRLFRLGTLVHEDIQLAIIKYKEEKNKDLTIGIETEINIPWFNVRGHIDVVIINDASKEILIYDMKTAHSFKWKLLFGQIKNRKPNADDGYRLQIATYILGMKEIEEYSDYDYEAILWYYKKDTSHTRNSFVDKRWIQQAIDYWGEVNTTLEGIEEPDDLTRGSYGIPNEDWECGYCPFESICK